jgi:3'-phosphoadenosine 5'-phosphosulfate sulfotransferase (PAPS reductase)/FAD synthetase
MSGNVHQASDLKQMQSLPLEAKIRMTKQRIKVWYESWVRFEIHDKATGKVRFITYDTRKGEPPLKDTEYIESAYDGQVYVSFSGGKDSTVLKHIVDSMYDDVPSLFVNTGLEYPEIQKFAMSQKNVVTVRPEMRFDEVIKKYGYPAVSKEVAQCVEQAKRNAQTGKYTYRIKRLNNELLDKEGKPSRYNIPQWKFLLDADFDISHQCCNVMKKKPAKAYEKESGRKAIIGTLAQESRLRQQKWIQNGCNAFEGKRPTSQPLSFWTEQDILHYIKKYDVPYCSVYGDIQVKAETDVEGQMNLIDYLECYEPEDLLETTGCDRTGCIFCMFGCHLEKEPNRFQRLKETHPRQYQYCIGGGEMVDGKWQPSKEGLGLGKVLDYIGVKYD